MKFIDALTLASVGFLTASIAVIALSPMKSSKQPTEPSRVLCEEVAHEINLWYQDGEISREEANRIIERCFNTFNQ